MKKILTASSLLFLLGLPLPLQGEELRLDTTLLGQVRENENNQTESPVNGYFGLGVRSPKIGGETDLRLFRDFSRSLDDIDLYQALLEVRPVERLEVKFGRQFLNEGFSVEIVDGLKTSLHPTPYWTIAAYSGIPRRVEEGDFNRDDGLLTGVTAGFSGIARTSAKLGAAWRKNDWGRGDLRQNDSVQTSLSLSHAVEMSAAPLFYGLTEYNATGRTLETVTGGVDFFPASRVSLNLEGNYTNIDRQNERRTILALFSNGPVVSGRLASTWMLIPDRLDLVQTYSYQRTEAPAGTKRNGHLVQTGFPLLFDEVGFQLQPSYYFFQSFGGNVHGVRGEISKELLKRLTLETGVELSRYEKITNDNDSALSVMLWGTVKLPKGWTTAAGFEYNRNNLFESDVRGSFRLEYHYGKV